MAKKKAEDKGPTRPSLATLQAAANKARDEERSRKKREDAEVVVAMAQLTALEAAEKAAEGAEE